jgi:hypothetical protein
MGTFGITDFNSSSALCKDGTIDKNNPSNPCINNGGVNWVDYTKLGGWTGGINPNGMYTNTATRTPVLCKDGTTDFSLSSSNAKYDNTKVCANNGGRAENQTSVAPPTEKVNLSPSVNLSAEEKFYQSLGLKDRGGWSPTVKAKGRFLVAVVLVAGYFAYKKFKK